MKKIKLNILTILTLFITSSIFYSCSDENNEILPENYIEKGLKYKNKLYIANEQGVTSKYENDLFKYNIFVKNSQLSTLELKSESTEDEFIIRNSETNEYIEIINVEKFENYYTFDLINNLGDRFNDFTYYGEMFQANAEAKCPPCVIGAIIVIVDAVIDLISGSPLQQCSEAMNTLSCPEGSSPYMNFSSGWFGPSCDVGCSNNP